MKQRPKHMKHRPLATPLDQHHRTSTDCKITTTGSKKGLTHEVLGHIARAIMNEHRNSIKSQFQLNVNGNKGLTHEVLGHVCVNGARPVGHHVILGHLGEQSGVVALCTRCTEQKTAALCMWQQFCWWWGTTWFWATSVNNTGW